MPGDSDFHVSAALLRRSQDSLAMVHELAARLGRALPVHVQVRRTGWMSGRRVRFLVVDLTSDRFRIEVDGDRPVAWIDRVVRGVCIRSDEVSLDGWLDCLAEALSNEARRSVDVRLALEEALR